MSHFLIRGLEFDDDVKEILAPAAAIDQDISEVYLACKEWTSQPQNMVYDNPIIGGGLFPLDDIGEKFTGLVVQMALVTEPMGGGNTWRLKFADAAGPAIESRRIFGGDFLAEGAGNLPVANSANVMPIIELATSPTLVKVVTGGLSEGDKDDIAGRVWDRLLSAHLVTGSFGQFVQKKLLTVTKFLGLK